MNPSDRLKILTGIALKLQTEYNTAGIDILLSGYGVDTGNAEMVSSKKGYVIDLLKTESNDTVAQIASDLGIFLPSRVAILKNENTEKLEKIFISHSSLDSKLVEKVIDILEAIGVPSDKVFCSSLEGYGVKLGSDFLDTIKNELNSKVLVLFILSSNFYSSVVSLCEMGATWVKTNQHIPILIPPFSYEDIKGVIPTTHGMKINEKEKFNSLKEQVEKFLNLVPVSINVWERRRDNILSEIKSILETQNSFQVENIIIPVKVIGEVSKPDNHLEIIRKIKEQSKIEWPNNFEMQLDYIQKQQSAVNKLENHHPFDIDLSDFKSIQDRAKIEWPNNYEMQLDYEQKQVESLRRLNKM